MAGRFVTPFTDPEQQALTSAYDHGEKSALRRRPRAILLSHQGHIFNKISEMLSQDGSSSGRPRTLMESSTSRAVSGRQPWMSTTKSDCGHLLPSIFIRFDPSQPVFKK